MNHGQAHRLVEELLDLITRTSVTEPERARIIEILTFLRRERRRMVLVARADCRAAHRAQHLAADEGLIWENLPDEVRAAMIREVTEVDLLDRAYERGFPPEGNEG